MAHMYTDSILQLVVMAGEDRRVCRSNPRTLRKRSQQAPDCSMSTWEGARTIRGRDAAIADGTFALLPSHGPPVRMPFDPSRLLGDRWIDTWRHARRPLVEPGA
jgi:hypothetical protein